MLSTNVLCIKKKKKRSYCIVNRREENGPTSTERSKRSAGGTMLQITEDTPPDMLAGAMDLTVHLPTGRSVKMSVERSTPMMDLLVQITTNYHLQLSGYTLQVLGMAPSQDHSDTVLPYKPNTPIGALDTQHIRVVPKSRNISVPKNVPPGHQPFESTFRLKVHLPRNQLYVTRVSQSVHLEDIMKKVCDEKNLDASKYEFRHPGNLDEVLDPKLTLSDYAITEIYLVQKGSLNQTFSTGDIMSLRKEEERRQMHNKTGGGVFNLIFRRGKSSTGSLSSENRSISPTHSDDSRSVTPPAVQQPIITPPEPDKPKPPQRKRRPAPKPPVEKKTDQSLTICHSRNSSDSSGYHEASILSDNNTSLPRRPKSTMITEDAPRILSQQHSQSTSNLSKLAAHSKSSTSLAVPSRKKKSAPPPPPPPVLKSEKTQTNLEEPSPVVASQPCTVAQTETHGNGQDNVVDNNTNPKPKPRTRTRNAPPPRPHSLVSDDSLTNIEAINANVVGKESETVVETLNPQVQEESAENKEANNQIENEKNKEIVKEEIENEETKNKEEMDVGIQVQVDTETNEEAKKDEAKIKEEKDVGVQVQVDEETPTQEMSVQPLKTPTEDLNEDIRQKASALADLQKQSVNSIFGTSAFKTKPEVVALHPKPIKKEYNKFDSYTRKRGFQIGSSLLDDEKNSSDVSTPTSVSSALNAFDFVDEIEGLDEEMFTGSLSGKSKKTNMILNQLHGMHELGSLKKNPSAGSLRSVRSFPGFIGSNMKKWNNIEELDDISLNSFGGQSGWVIGDTSDTESIASTQPLDSLASVQSLPPTAPPPEEKHVEAPPVETEKNEEPPCEKKQDEIAKEPELEPDWQYQLPSPPKAFRDSSPVPEESTVDSVVTSPELFEKLKVIKDNQSETVSDITSVVSEEEKPILNKLSLENLEKRKSLVYNRELATSLKMQDEDRKKDAFSSSLINFEKTYDEVKRSSPKEAITTTSTLPNFKITTYNNPKQKIDIFEDDTIRSGTKTSFSLKKNYMGTSMENISFRKDSLENSKPPVPKPLTNVGRSESFSKEWVPIRPVARSKSQLILNKYRDKKNLSQIEDDSLTKSNSLFDVSGLSSLGVLRSIQNKLNTPNNSTEHLDKEEPSYQKQPEIEIEVQKPPITKTYQYKPPSINMSTWSERPKIPVNVKEDPDYKFGVKGTTNSSKLIVNTVNNEIKSHNSVEVKNKTSNFTNGVVVRVGSDLESKNSNNKVVSSESGNVVIKIGGTNTINNKPVFRKPLGNVNTEHQRPHSIALDGDFDISRVPIVRSVEFKKPYNTSVTQIYQNNNTSSWNKNEAKPKPVFRVNSHLQSNSVPVVRGFRNGDTWNQPKSFSTLPAKSGKNFALDAPVPFSNVRRTESIDKKIPPPAPVMPKITNSRENFGQAGDPKEQLLQAIRDFGGKKGLRAVKA